LTLGTRFLTLMLIAGVVAVATDPALAKEHPSGVVSQEFQPSIPRHFTELTADQCPPLGRSPASG